MPRNVAIPDPTPASVQIHIQMGRHPDTEDPVLVIHAVYEHAAGADQVRIRADQMTAGQQTTLTNMVNAVINRLMLANGYT